jgi:dTMP kinase
VSAPPVPPARTGIFLTLEGPEGAGKTTQSRLLVEYLHAAGYTVVHTREPGGTPIGEQIRTLLLDPQHREMAARTEMLLFAASRAQLVADVIAPALARGAVVLCERYVDASVAYQGVGRGLGVEVVRAVNAAATGGLSPDLTVLLDLDPEAGLRRARGPSRASVAQRGWDGGDRIEREAPAFHARVREGFLALARNEPQRIRVIDARGPVNDVQREIRRTVDGFLHGRGGDVKGDRPSS